jgi:hypothetical protein
MVTSIKSLLKCLELFLSLKNKLFYYDIIQKSKARQNEIIKQIEDLRTKGDSNSADAADLLLVSLKREKYEIESLSNLYIKATEK